MGVDPETHPILPADFVESWGGESVADALRIAEQAPSTTPRADMPRCPNVRCHSTRYRVKSSRANAQREIDSAYRCVACGRHFDDPINTGPNNMTEANLIPFEWMDDDDQQLADPADRGVDDDALTELAIRAYRPWSDERGASYREIATLLPYSRQWVGERVRAWKAGDYRDLVPDPTADPTPSVDADGASAVATDGGRVSRWDAFGSD